MIVIRCYGEEAFGGRTSDLFVLDEFNDLDELKSYIEAKQPIMCMEPMRIYKHSIIDRNSLSKRIVYLNNYLSIKETGHYVMSKSEIMVMDQTTCNGCQHNCDSLSAALACSFSKVEDDMCANYETVFSFRKWLKSKFV